MDLLNRRSLPLWLALQLIAFSTVTAQDSLQYLGLEEAQKAAISSNSNLAVAGMTEKIADARYKETQSIYLPTASLSYTAMLSNNPLMVFGSKLQQKSVAAADFNPALLNDPANRSDFSTRIDVQQPLINADSWLQRKAAALQSQLSRLNTERARDQVAYEVENTYYQLQLSYQARAVWDSSLQTARALYEFTNNRVEQGLLQASDALNISVRVSAAQTQLTAANSQIRQISDYLNLLMHRPLGSVYLPDSSTGILPAYAEDAQLPAARADLKALDQSLELASIGLKVNKASRLPRLNAFGSYQFNDAAALGFGARAWLIGLQLNLPIFQGQMLKNRYHTQLLERQQLEVIVQKTRDEAQLQLRAAQRAINDARYLISEQELAVHNASETVRILENRYRQGLVNSTDVLLAQTQLSQQKLALAQAQYEYKKGLAYIAFLTKSSQQ